MHSGSQALASTLESDEIRDLRDQFDAMDVDRNGTITLEEIKHVRRSNLVSFIQDTELHCPALISYVSAGCICKFWFFILVMFYSWFFGQALQKDRPWAVKESRVLEILQAVRVLVQLFRIIRGGCYYYKIGFGRRPAYFIVA